MLAATSQLQSQLTMSISRVAPLHRRRLFQRAGFGAGALALASVLRGSAFGAAANPLASREPMFAPRAKRVIFLHMIGAPSQLDMYDYKP